MLSSTSCARTSFAVLAIVCLLYSSFAAFFGLFSMEWFTGYLDVAVDSDIRVNIGLVTGCQNVIHVKFGIGKLNFCQHFAWEGIHDAVERALVIRQMMAAICGVLACLLMICNLLFRQFYSQAFAIVTEIAASGLSLALGILLLTNCLYMATAYRWRPPYGTHVGPPYICCIVGFSTAMVASCLAGLYHRENMQEYRIKEQRQRLGLLCT